MSTSNTTLRHFLLGKPVPALDSCDTVKDAMDMMDRYGSHAVGVNVDSRFSGLFTHSDFIKRVLRNDLNPRHTAVGSVMTLDPVSILPDASIKEAYYLMCNEKFSHLPVVENGKLYGIISEDDLRNEIANDLIKITKEHNILMSYFREPYGLCAHY